MKTRISSCLLIIVSLIFTACGERQGPMVAGQTAPETAVQGIPNYSAEDFFGTTSFGLVGSGAHAFSPDGLSLLISSDSTGVFNAYALPLDGEPAEPLTNSEDNAVFAVSWFPKDKRILYTYDSGGNELNHVIVREEDGGSRDLTPGDALKAGFLKWSDDGESFYLTSTERNQHAFDIYRYSAKDYSRELVYENPGFQISDISGNGRWVVLDKPRTSANSDIYVVDLASENPQPMLITEHEGSIEYGTYGITPDSNALIYATNEHGEFNQAWKHDLESGEKSLLIEAAWDVSYVAYSRSGRYRVSGINADARTAVTIMDNETGIKLEFPELPQGDLRSVRFSADESHVALIINADDSPSNIHVIDLVDGNARQLTDALNPVIDQSQLVSSEIIRYKSFDGLEIPSILYKPRGASADHRVPALVLVHGGPGGQTRTGYRAMV